MRGFARRLDDDVPPSGQDAPRGRIYGSAGHVAVPTYPQAQLVSVRVHRAATDTWEDVPIVPPTWWSRFSAWARSL